VLEILDKHGLADCELKESDTVGASMMRPMVGMRMLREKARVTRAQSKAMGKQPKVYCETTDGASVALCEAFAAEYKLVEEKRVAGACARALSPRVSHSLAGRRASLPRARQSAGLPRSGRVRAAARIERATHRRSVRVETGADCRARAVGTGVVDAVARTRKKCNVSQN
jgi:hypothetical protein